MDIQYFGKRNYGCRIREYTADGLRCVSLENNLVRVGILLDKGADIFEFVYKPRDVDFMFTSPLPFAKNIIPTSANPAGNFMDYYEGQQERKPQRAHAQPYRNLRDVIL